MRGKALEGGSHGDTINVLNVQSKRPVQGKIAGPGHVDPGPDRLYPVVAQLLCRGRCQLAVDVEPGRCRGSGAAQPVHEPGNGVRAEMQVGADAAHHVGLGLKAELRAVEGTGLTLEDANQVDGPHLTQRIA